MQGTPKLFIGSLLGGVAGTVWPRQDTLVFQVDLWSARGPLPRNLIEVETRHKEVLYSSRTRDNVDRFVETQRLRHAIAKHFAKLPKNMHNMPEAQSLRRFADHKVYNIVHLIYRPFSYEGFSKDYDFSRLSMGDHWRAGYDDTIRALNHPGALERPTNGEGVTTHDPTAPKKASRAG